MVLSWRIMYTSTFQIPGGARFCLWFFEKYLNGRQAVYDHSFRELRYFKERLEAVARERDP